MSICAYTRVSNAYIHICVSHRVWNEYWEVQTYYNGIMKIFPDLADNTAYLRQRPGFVKRLAAWV